jgi:hypothetical protein
MNCSSAFRLTCRRSDAQPRLHHYRSHAGHDVDNLLERPDGQMVGIEVKAAASVAERDLGGLSELAAVAGERYARGVILYAGDPVVPFARNIHALPLPCLGGCPLRPADDRCWRSLQTTAAETCNRLLPGALRPLRLPGDQAAIWWCPFRIPVGWGPLQVGGQR